MIAKYVKSKKESSQAVFFSVFLGVLVLGIIGFLIFSNFKMNQRRGVLYSQIESLKGEIQDLQDRKAGLEGRVSESSEEEYIEKEARERLGLKKPGEEVVVVVPPEEGAGQETEEKGFWQRFFEKLKFW